MLAGSMVWSATLLPVERAQSPLEVLDSSCCCVLCPLPDCEGAFAECREESVTRWQRRPNHPDQVLTMAIQPNCYWLYRWF